MAEMDTPTPIIEEKPYKKMAPKFFAFTPESNGYYRVAILVNYDKAKNRPELVKELNIQEFRSVSGGYFATRESTTMLLHSFEVLGINEKHFDREYYSIYVDLESTEDLEDIGILVHKGHKPPIM